VSASPESCPRGDAGILPCECDFDIDLGSYCPFSMMCHTEFRKGSERCLFYGRGWRLLPHRCGRWRSRRRVDVGRDRDHVTADGEPAYSPHGSNTG